MGKGCFLVLYFFFLVFCKLEITVTHKPNKFNYIQMCKVMFTQFKNPRVRFDCAVCVPHIVTKLTISLTIVHLNGLYFARCEPLLSKKNTSASSAYYLARMADII